MTSPQIASLTPSHAELEQLKLKAIVIGNLAVWQSVHVGRLKTAGANEAEIQIDIERESVVIAWRGRVAFSWRLSPPQV